MDTHLFKIQKEYSTLVAILRLTILQPQGMGKVSKNLGSSSKIVICLVLPTSIQSAHMDQGFTPQGMLLAIFIHQNFHCFWNHITTTGQIIGDPDFSYAIVIVGLSGLKRADKVNGHSCTKSCIFHSRSCWEEKP